MVPDSFISFFAASAGSGAALLGLLFVSISISPEEKITANATVERRVLAYAALNSLINAFFISMAALIPSPSNLGIALMIFGVISVAITLQNSFELLRSAQVQGTRNMLRRLPLTVFALLTFLAQCYYGLMLLINPNNAAPVYYLTTILLVVYVTGIIRAWELLGGIRTTPMKIFTHSQQKAEDSTK
jgi:hypothetical protein